MAETRAIIVIVYYWVERSTTKGNRDDSHLYREAQIVPIELLKGVDGAKLRCNALKRCNCSRTREEQQQ